MKKKKLLHGQKENVFHVGRYLIAGELVIEFVKNAEVRTCLKVTKIQQV